MQKSRFEWRVGLFVFIGLVLVALLMLQFSKGLTWFRPTYNIYLTAPSIGGLKQHATVTLAGVAVGSVSDFRLNPGGTNVTITLRIFKPYVIHRDARFVIEQSGFLGDQFVAIKPTENRLPVFQPGGHAVTQAPFNIQEMARSASGFLERMDETATNVNAAVSDVRRLVLNEKTLTNLSVSIAAMRLASERALTAMDNVNQLIDTNSPSIAEAVSNVVYFSGQVNKFGNAFGQVVSTNSAQFTAAMKNIESSTRTLRSLLADLQAGKGLAGSLLQNETLAADFNDIADNLAITSSNLNRLGLWGILWSHKPPRTNPPPGRILESPKNPF